MSSLDRLRDILRSGRPGVPSVAPAPRELTYEPVDADGVPVRGLVETPALEGVRHLDTPYGQACVLEHRVDASAWHGAVRVDAGIVEVDGVQRYVLCLMTERHPETSFSAEHPGAVLNGRISRLVFDAWGGQ